jgi:hypothetical protein
MTPLEFSKSGAVYPWAVGTVSSFVLAVAPVGISEED